MAKYEMEKIRPNPTLECESKDCVYNDGDGECRFYYVKGRTPTITEEDGCVDGVIPMFP